MNFAKRAWLNLIAKKGRTALLVLVTSAIMLFVLAGLLIRSAANTATENAKESVGATLTLSANREAAFKKMRSQMSSSSGKPSGKPSLTATPVKLSDAKKIAALSDVSDYSVTVSTSANAKDFDTISTSSSIGGNSFGGGMGGSTSSGDTTVSGVSATSSNSNFTDGTDKIVKGRGLTVKDAGTQNVVIEKELATQNGFSVGDTIKLKATTDTKKTYTLKIVGIYKAKSTSTSSMGMNASDPSNTVFTSYTFANTLKGAKYKNTADSITFDVSAPSKVNAVKKAAKKLINTKKFAISSDDANYLMVKQSMSTVTGFADKIVWLVAIAGTIILALIVILMIRERRYEIGVLLSMGEQRGRIIAQFFTELFVILLVAVGIAGIGGSFVGDKLGQQLVTSQTTATSSTNATAGGMQQGGGQGGPSGQTGGAPSGTQGGGQMPGMSSKTASTKTQQTKLTTKVTGSDMLRLILFGLVIILIAILVGAGGILRMQPKKILIG